METLLSHQGARVIESIELEAAHSPKLRFALGAIYPHAIAESVRERVIAPIPDDAGATLIALVPPNPGSIRIDVSGRPPTRPGSRSPEQIARREALLDAFVAANGAEFVPWTTPARLEVVVGAGPDGDPTASAGDVLQGVIDSLALDRHRGLVGAGQESLGLVAIRSLIRGGEVRYHNSADASYLVWTYRMHESELRA